MWSEGLENDQEEGESMDAMDQYDETMMAAMGITGFGSTKVCVLPGRVSQYLEILIGEARRREPRGWRKDQESSNVEAVHESVRRPLVSMNAYLTPRTSSAAVDSIGPSPLLSQDSTQFLYHLYRPLDKIK